jgi:hypothetical protein
MRLRKIILYLWRPTGRMRIEQASANAQDRIKHEHHFDPEEFRETHSREEFGRGGGETAGSCGQPANETITRKSPGSLGIRCLARQHGVLDGNEKAGAAGRWID